MKSEFTGTLLQDLEAIVRASEGRCPKKPTITQTCAFLRNDEAPVADWDDFDAERNNQ